MSLHKTGINGKMCCIHTFYLTSQQQLPCQSLTIPLQSPWPPFIWLSSLLTSCQHKSSTLVYIRLQVGIPQFHPSSSLSNPHLLTTFPSPFSCTPCFPASPPFFFVEVKEEPWGKAFYCCCLPLAYHCTHGKICISFQKLLSPLQKKKKVYIF